MNKLLTILSGAVFLLAFLSGTASAKWSLLENYQLHDVSGEKGICVPSQDEECDLKTKKYNELYAEDDLDDDMEETREAGLEMIYEDDFLQKHPYMTFPVDVTNSETPVPGEPFFASDWYNPDDLSGWEKLLEKIIRSAPPP